MEFLTIRETAQMLRVSPITIRRYIASGQLAAERVGLGIRIRREAIDPFITPIRPSPCSPNAHAQVQALIGRGHESTCR